MKKNVFSSVSSACPPRVFNFETANPTDTQSHPRLLRSNCTKRTPMVVAHTRGKATPIHPKSPSTGVKQGVRERNNNTKDSAALRVTVACVRWARNFVPPSISTSGRNGSFMAAPRELFPYFSFFVLGEIEAGRGAGNAKPQLLSINFW